MVLVMCFAREKERETWNMEQIKEVIYSRSKVRQVTEGKVPVPRLEPEDCVRTGSCISLTEAEVGITKNAATPSSITRGRVL